MKAMLDSQLLSEFVRTGSHDAFADLVRRHIDAVYASARRQVRDAQLAEDVTQAVFIVLTKKAGSLRPQVPLIGWLLKTTYFASRDALKTEARRRRHEQQAATMRKTIESVEIPDISLKLDWALTRLAATDRSVIAMRFLEEKSIAEIAGVMNLSRDAAAKRLARALAKLRHMLLDRNNLVATAPIEAMLAAIARPSAPPHLAAASINVSNSASISTSSVIAKGAMKMIFWSQAKVAICILAVAAVVGGTAVGARSLVHAAAATAEAQSSQGHSAKGFIGQLKDGPSVEVLGVGEADKATGQVLQWWSVDGSPLDFGPYKTMNASFPSSPLAANDIVREFAVRINPTLTGSSQDASEQWYLRNTGPSAGAIPKDYNGRDVRNLSAVVVELPDNPSGATLRADVATGPWQSRIKNSPEYSVCIDINGTSYFVSQCFEKDGKTHVIYCISRQANADVRLIARTKSGNTLEFSAGTISAAGNVTMTDAGLTAPMNEIKSIELQTRRYNQWIEIRHISLHADQKTNVQIITSDQTQK
jgi:RNA polymerase sigma factor (sigma-70 family)